MTDAGNREKILTFPGFGYLGIAVEIFLKDMGIRYVAVPVNEETEKTEAFRNAPEDMCLPFKLFAAQLEQAWEKGANTAVMVSSKGPCRLGEFCELLHVLLGKQGCNYEWIVLDTPSDIGIRELFHRIRRIFPDKRMTPGEQKKLIVGINHTRHLIFEMEKFESELRREAGYYENPIKAIHLIRLCRKEVKKAENLKQAFDIMGRFRWEKTQLKKDFSKKPVKILITGEIFSLNEPAASMEIKDRLTQMGVCLECDITMGWWIRRSAFHAIAYPFRQEGRKRSGKTHIPCDIGGYARQSVENASSSAIRGFDGVIHIYPSGCMPEIVSHAVLNRIGERENIRIMTLVCDEMSAEAGIMTRIEAFADMLQRVKGADGS